MLPPGKEICPRWVSTASVRRVSTRHRLAVTRIQQHQHAGPATIQDRVEDAIGPGPRVGAMPICTGSPGSGRARAERRRFNHGDTEDTEMLYLFADRELNRS